MEKIVVIKIGTNVLVDENGKIKRRILRALARQIASLRQQGYWPVIVTSGAVACGNGVAGGEKIIDKQVAASVGQPKLMAYWIEAFRKRGLIASQIQGTHQDFKHPKTIALIRRELEIGIVPVLNENDSVSALEIKAMEHQGDNDALAVIVAIGIGASKLILLSDVDGLQNRKLKVISIVPVIDDAIKALAGVEGVKVSNRNGMGSKLIAAEKATRAGITVHLAKGSKPNVITKILGPGRTPGTTFLAQKP